MPIVSDVLRFNHFLVPEAAQALGDNDDMAKKLISHLEDGASFPTFIGIDDLRGVGIDVASHPSVKGSEPGKKLHRDIKARTCEDQEVAVEGGEMSSGTSGGISIPKTIEKRDDVAPVSDLLPGASPGTDLLRPELGDVSELVKRTTSLRRSTLSSVARPLIKEGVGGKPRPLAAEYDGDVKILFDPVEHMGSKGKIEDFRRLFLDRYRTLRNILRTQYGELIPTEDAGTLQPSDEHTRVIGLVMELRTSKNGHIMFDLEDPTGSVKVLISKNKEIFNNKVVDDEVIGIVGKFKKDDRGPSGIIFADEVFKADLPFDYQRRTSEIRGLTAAFSSDIHIGSVNFLRKEWDRMVRWLKGEVGASIGKREGGCVKYLVFAGDLVDGIGIYPNQDRDLICKDIGKQYEMLAEAMSDIPSHVEIILLPGNHDAVRLAEPQPPIPREYQEYFYNDHLHFLSNPAFISLSGVRVTGFHGKSLDDMVTQFKDVTYETPVEGMREMVRSRHFGPTYGMRNQLAPEDVDLLIMREAPDILVSGHVHRFGYTNYRGMHLIQGSTWQSQTDFQKMMNLQPQPAKMAIVGLDSPDDIRTWELEYSS
ncbi:MAG: DNA-directed DNA polymerase II small subunit [Thermoplasmata archaeon]|nr:DNA-directed DNA polymerase II small subunit [Thermoplasmata archaeon]